MHSQEQRKHSSKAGAAAAPQPALEGTHSGSNSGESSLAYVSAKSSLHSRQTTYSDGDEDEEPPFASSLGHPSLGGGGGGVHYFQDITTSRSFPSSNSLASPSTEDSPHELWSASETPFFAPPPPTAPYSTIPITASHSTTAVAPRTLSHPRTRPTPLILDATNTATTASAPPPPTSAKTPSTASTVHHVRIGSKPSARGFPYASSILTTSTSCANLRGSSANGHHVMNQHQHRLSRASGGSGEDGSLQSHRSSSDVDLDMSFDLHDESGETIMQGEQDKARWVGIDMQAGGAEEREKEQEERQGTKRVQSAVDIRAAYLAGEKAAVEAAAAVGKTVGPPPFAGVAILMDNNVGPHNASTAAGHASDRSSWIRKPSADGGVLPLAAASSANPHLARKNIPAPLEPTYKRLSPGRGYAFNPTDPVSVPLPDSPDALQPLTTAGVSKAAATAGFTRPLNLIERTRNLSLSSSPGAGASWSIGALFSAAGGGQATQDKGKGREEHRFASPGQEEDLEYDSPATKSTSWAEATRGYLRGGSKVGRGRRSHSEAATTPRTVESPESSPLFGCSGDDGEGGLDSARTDPTTPNDTPRTQEFGHHQQGLDDVPVQVTLGRSVKERKGRLDGLGLDMRGDGGEEKRLPGKPLPRAPEPSVTRPGHVTIPSLSISPPDEDEDDDDDALSTTSADSAQDPTVSPSRRLSNRSSSSTLNRSAAHARVHYPPVTATEAPIKSSTMRRLFAPTSSSHLLASSTGGKQSPTSQRFSFTPAPLHLVADQQHALRASAASPSPSTMSRLSRISLTAAMHHLQEAHAHLHPSTWLEAHQPSKLLFFAAFLLGPWCFLVGGWALRGSDGELNSTPKGARRCVEEGCRCGRLVGGKGRVRVQAAGHGWAELEKWVVCCRIGAMVSTGLVGVLVAVAVWAAVVGA